MTKADLINKVAASKAVPKDISKKAVQAVVDATFDEIKKSIKKEERFSFPGFGTFNKRKRAARSGRNPQTGEKIKIKAQMTVGFRPAQAVKDYMGGTSKKR